MFTGIVLVIYDSDIRKYNVVKILPNGDKVILDPTEDESVTNAVVDGFNNSSIDGNKYFGL